jgi:intracellular multiplication protein IcmP
VSQQQKSPHEEFIMACIVIFLVGGLTWIIWTIFHVELTSFLRWIRVGELYVASLLVADDYHFVHQYAGPQYLEQWKEWLPRANAEDITPEYIKVMSYLALAPIKIIFVVLLLLMALWSIFKGPGTYYRRKMGLEEIIAEQSHNFPYIQPFVKFNPNKMKSRAPGDPVPYKLPLFAEALAPEEWVAYHQVALTEGKLDFAAAYRALSKQLGPRWQGPEKLPIHARGLYAAFALKAVRRRPESDQLLKDMAVSWSHKGGFKPSAALRSRINKIIRNEKICGDINKYTRKHAYQTTAMLRAMQRAREEGGVLASAQFVWLRGYDRNLWYPLNNLGRRSYHAEAAGAMAHYTNELIADQKIPSPRFEEVIVVLEQTLTGPDARRIPKRVAS